MAGVIAAGAGTERKRTGIVLAALLAAVAAALVFAGLQQRGEDGGGGGAAAAANVVVAKRDIPANTKLSADMLRVQALPEGAMLDAAYESVTPLVGLPARYPIEAGEQLTPLKVGLKAIENEDDLALVVGRGKRAFSVEMSEITGVGGLLLPGNMVDVIGVFHENTAGTDRAVMLLQNIEVLSVGQEAQEPVARPAGPPRDAEPLGGIRALRPEEAEHQPEARTVTLAVTPNESLLLAVAQENGRLWLALRPFDDDEIESLGEQQLLPLLQPVQP